MPELEMERRERSGVPPWVWILLAILVIALIWWAIAAMDRDEEAAAPGMPLGQIAASPQNYFEQEVSGLATVEEILSDNAFWITQDGQRMLTVYGGSPLVVVNRQVSMTATVISPQEYATEDIRWGLPDLDPQTRSVAANQPAILHATNVELQQP
jgi:hypothetical protein